MESKNIVTYEYQMKWKLNNVSKMKSPGYRTPVFSPNSSTDSRFCLEVWYEIENSASVLSVTLRKMSSDSVPSSAEFEVEVNVYYSDDSLYKSYKSLPESASADWSSKLCFQDYSPFTYPKSIETTSDTGSPKFFFCCAPAENTPHAFKMESDTLLLECVMKFTNHLPSSEMYHKKISSLYTLSELSGNLVGLFESSAFSDVVIRIEDKYILAHKCVLAAHSPLFKNELGKGLQETNTIAISGFDPNVVESFIKFLYSTKIEDKSIYSIRQHYMLALKYEVLILKQECVRIITDSFLTVGYICGVLKMALDFKDKELKRRAIIYASDHIQEIKKTTAWRDLSKSFPEFCCGIVCFNISSRDPNNSEKRDL